VFARSESAKAGLEKRKRAVQDFQELHVEGEGHHLHLEAPHTILPAVHRFLRDTAEEPPLDSRRVAARL
jgi:pimeloyl-ACP methyl ester carboxylesterase